MLSIVILLVCKLGVYEDPTDAAEVFELVEVELVAPVEVEVEVLKVIFWTVLANTLEFNVNSKALESGIKL